MLGMFLHRRETKKAARDAEAEIQTPSETEEKSGDFAHYEGAPGLGGEVDHVEVVKGKNLRGKDLMAI